MVVTDGAVPKRIAAIQRSWDTGGCRQQLPLAVAGDFTAKRPLARHPAPSDLKQGQDRVFHGSQIAYHANARFPKLGRHLSGDYNLDDIYAHTSDNDPGPEPDCLP